MGKSKFYILLPGFAVVTFLFWLYSSELMAADDSSATLQNGIDLVNDLAGATSVQSADLDLDGDLDVVSAGRESGLVLWHVNDGGVLPQFARQEVGVVQGAYMVLPADLDRDGDADLVVAGVGELSPASVEQSLGATGSIIWFENNLRTGAGFTPHPVASELPYSVAVHVADLDRDGDLDLVMAARDGNSVTWYENLGGAPPSFAPHLVTTQAMGAVSVHSGDLDKDGDLDLISASENDNKIAIYLNDGARPPNFAEVVAYQPGVPDPKNDYAKGVYGADLDDDGDIDIAYVSEGNNEVGWLENIGGAPPAFVPHILGNNADHAKTVLATDFDRDGDLDLLVASSGDNKITWFINDGQQPANFTAVLMTTSAMGARAVHAADLDGDGDMDLLSASRDDNRITWYPNPTIHRTALYSEATQRVIAINAAARGVHAADIDGDGDMDLLSISERDVAWHENNGASPPGFTSHVIGTDIDGGRWVTAGDLDGDGDMDVAAASKRNNLISWYENVGGSPPGFVSHIVTQDAIGARAVLVEDIDRDGALDLYSASDSDDTISWYKNLGGHPPTFERRYVTRAADYARSVFAIDLDGDGDIDMMSASQLDNTVAWYENLGANSLTWAMNRIDTGASGVLHIHAADLDGDGDADLVTALELMNAVRWYENLGTKPPTFAMHVITENARAVHAVYAADADQDGDQDIFAAIEGNNTVAWYENLGGKPPTFAERIIVNNTAVAHGIDAADIDGDGDLDALSASRADGKVAWYENVGGQYAFSSEVDPENSRLLHLVISSRGRPGDPDLALRYVELQLQDDRGAPLTTEQANALIERINVYRVACCDRILDPTSSPLMATVAPLEVSDGGRLLIPLLEIDPNTRIPAGGSAALAVLIEGAANSCQNGLSSFRAVSVASNQLATNSSNGLPLLGEFMRSGDQPPVSPEPERPVVTINEFLASNDNGLVDPDDPGEYPDWIELYNSAVVPYDLSGKYLTDDLTIPDRQRIADGIVIPANGYVLFYADGEPEQGPYHLNFKLEKNGESIGLYEATPTGIKKLDEVVFGEQKSNVSSGRYPDGSATWQETGAPTPRRPNISFVSVSRVQLPLVQRGVACP